MRIAPLSVLAAALAVPAALPANAQTPPQAEFCYRQASSYVADAVTLRHHGEDGVRDLVRHRAVPPGRAHCVRVPAPTSREARFEFTATAFAHSTTREACRLVLPIPPGRASRVVVTMRGTAFQPGCERSEG